MATIRQVQRVKLADWAPNHPFAHTSTVFGLKPPQSLSGESPNTSAPPTPTLPLPATPEAGEAVGNQTSEEYAKSRGS